MSEINKNCSDIFTNELKIIFDILNKNDNVRLVGGCVRNYLINKKINDYDICTKLLPQQVVSTLSEHNIKTIPTGIKFGTITALVNNHSFEITTLRVDKDTDGRHAKVDFTDSYLEDAKRRDFTFNALYIDGNGKLYDYFNGIGDLKKGLIRFIGDPEKRIEEDYLRILRFFRFYSEYSYAMDYKSFNACVKYQENILKLSKERVREEFLKIINSNYSVKVLNILKNYNFLEYIVGYNNFDFYNLEIFFSIKNYINFNNYDKIFILILILSKNKVDLNILLTNNEKKLINILLNIDVNINENSLTKLFYKYNDKNLLYYLIIIYFINNYNKNSIDSINTYIRFVENLEYKELPINGNDLIENGFNNKKEYSKLIELAKNYWIDNNFKKNREDIVEYLKNLVFI